MQPTNTRRKSFTCSLCTCSRTCTVTSAHVTPLPVKSRSGDARWGFDFEICSDYLKVCHQLLVHAYSVWTQTVQQTQVILAVSLVQQSVVATCHSGQAGYYLADYPRLHQTACLMMLQRLQQHEQIVIHTDV